MSYEAEVRSIYPWIGAKLAGGGGMVTELWGNYVRTTLNSSPRAWDRDEYSVDLTDPDTLAAFDRRLALRLGAPEEYVKDGAIVFTSAGQCCLRAGLGRFIDNWEWRADVTVDTDDPLLARVRAWNNAKP